MNKKLIAIILEIIPVLSAIISFILIVIPYGSTMISRIIPITVLLSFLGFIIFFISKKLDSKSKIVKVLGIFDCIATIFVIVLYVIAIFSFGL